MNNNSASLNPAYMKGISTEVRIKRKLRQMNPWTYRDSTAQQDKELDIDCWLGKVPVSIKSQPICQQTGNFAFELEMFDSVIGRWIPSWYQKGKAELYLLHDGVKLYQLIKATLQEWVTTHGWDSIRENTQTVNDMNMFHRSWNSRMGIISRDKLISQGIAIEM